MSIPEAILDIQDEIVRIEGKLESTGTEETLTDGARSALSSRLDYLYKILYELNREED